MNSRLAPIRIEPPDSLPVTVAEAKAWARIDHSDHNDMVTSLITAAVAHIDGHSGILGRCLVEQTWRQDYPYWRSIFRLPFPDVSSVTVKYYDASNVLTTVSPSLYSLLADERGAYIWFNSDFTEPTLYDDRQDAVQVTLVAGYGDPEDVPEAIKSAIKMLVAHWYDNPAAGAAIQEIPFGVSAILAPYRRVGM